MKRSKVDFALLILRIGLGSVFVYHGSQKILGWFGGSGIGAFAGYLTRMGLPFPHIGAVLAATSELLGGLSLLSGFGTRYLLVPLSATMMVATLVKARSGFDDSHGGAEFPLLCLCSILAIWLVGPGGLSLRASISGKKEAQ